MIGDGSDFNSMEASMKSLNRSMTFDKIDGSVDEFA